MASAAQPRLSRRLEPLWAQHHAQWRAATQVVAQWHDAATIDPRLLSWRADGQWWEVLAATRATLLVTREYEHLLVALRAGSDGRPAVSYLPIPHPSGLAADRRRGLVHLASTRNPNQIYDLAPVTGLQARADQPRSSQQDRPLIPVRSRFLPGSLYLHDLALIGGELYGNAVGHNAVARVDSLGQHELVWWPRSIDTARGPRFERNYLQMNSIAAGSDLRSSFFSASAARPSGRRPGQRHFAVDRRGVIFSGATREPLVTGLTRPHSARLQRGRLWVANSGYGELGIVDDGRFCPVARLPGWTRGLCFHGRIAFAGTSQVLPRFRNYAPGLDVSTAWCGIHAIDTTSGRLLGSLRWPSGNQIFAIDWLPSSLATGLPIAASYPRRTRTVQQLFYAFHRTTR